MTSGQRPLDSPIRALALFGALHAIWSDVHPVCDQIIQRGRDATAKGLPGPAGRKAAARHVASYSVGQMVAAELVTRSLGYRVPTRAMLAGHLINAVTHYVIDRRRPLTRLMRTRLLDKGDYLDHATVQRKAGLVDAGGPGTALFELDLHCTSQGLWLGGSSAGVAGWSVPADDGDVTVAEETGQRPVPRCWCCDGVFAKSDLVRLGAHPEVGVCSGCARYLQRRAVEHEDAGRRSPAARARAGVRSVRAWVIDRGWHDSRRVGRLLRRIDRHLP